ncbi:MAG: hypothetical protein IPH55_11805 [Betaproteobacteria bacterium]|nr:hypothetical protein [Betaproteobacteria bacterium]
MAQIRGRNTQPEKTIRSLLHREGFGFVYTTGECQHTRYCDERSRHSDICAWLLLAQARQVHKRKYTELNREFWIQKLQANVRRDRKTSATS